MGDHEVHREERAIYAVVIAALAPVVVVALVQHAYFGGGTTLSLGTIALAAAGFLASFARPVGLPRARVRPRARSRQRGKVLP